MANGLISFVSCAGFSLRSVRDIVGVMWGGSLCYVQFLVCLICGLQSLLCGALSVCYVQFAVMNLVALL